MDVCEGGYFVAEIVSFCNFVVFLKLYFRGDFLSVLYVLCTMLLFHGISVLCHVSACLFS